MSEYCCIKLDLLIDIEGILFGEKFEGILFGEKSVIRRTGNGIRGSENHSLTYGTEKMVKSIHAKLLFFI
jgi:hypothetical protein